MPIPRVLVIGKCAEFGNVIKQGLGPGSDVTFVTDTEKALTILCSKEKEIKIVVFGTADYDMDRKRFALAVRELNPCIIFIDAIYYLLKGLILAIEQLFPEDIIDRPRKLVQITLELIEHCYIKQISLKQIVTLSPSISSKQLSRAFKRYNKKTFTEKLKERRVAAAKTELITTSYTIEDITPFVGYQDVDKFYEVFKEITKMTPGEYRRKCGNKIPAKRTEEQKTAAVKEQIRRLEQLEKEAENFFKKIFNTKF